MKYHSYIKSLQMMLITMALLVSPPAFSEENEERSLKPLDGELLLPDDYEKSVKPLDGELLLPDDYNKAEDKKCMTVCDQWGEDCIINPRTGTRKCRRVCKSFTEECF